MKFTVSSSELQKRLGIILGTVPSKPVLPIVANILFEVQEGQLFLTATDMEIMMQTVLSVECDPKSIFNIALPGKIILDTLKALPEQELTFQLLPDSISPIVKIITNNGEYDITGRDGADFPRFTKADETHSITINPDVMNAIIDRTIFAVSTDEMKLALTGVYFQFGMEYADFVATDAHRLVRCRRTDIKANEPANFILPAKALKLVKNACTNANEDIILQYTDRNAFFYIDSTLLVCRLIDATFPDYESVIPKSSPNQAMIGKGFLLSTIKRLKNYANAGDRLAKFAFHKSEVLVSSDNLDGNKGRERISCIYEGQAIEIGFNISLMTEVLNNIDSEEVTLELDTPSRAAVVLPEYNQSNEELLMLLMPIVISESIEG
jgi:DNA polymerase-3 subunit beta